MMPHIFANICHFICKYSVGKWYKCWLLGLCSNNQTLLIHPSQTVSFVALGCYIILSIRDRYCVFYFICCYRVYIDVQRCIPILDIKAELWLGLKKKTRRREEKWEDSWDEQRKCAGCTYSSHLYEVQPYAQWICAS